MSEQVIARGTAVPGWQEAGGRLQRFSKPKDVLEAVEADPESTVALVASGGTTFLSPIIGRLAGIVCESGTLRSHLAIVSREYGIPCLMDVAAEGEIEDGVDVTMRAADGTLVRREAAG